MAEDLFVKTATGWKTPTNIFRKTGSGWQAVSEVYRKHGSGWIKHWPSIIEFTSPTIINTADGSLARGRYRQWGPLQTLQIPSAVLSTSVAHVTRGRLVWSGNTLTTNDDDSMTVAYHDIQIKDVQYSIISQASGVSMGAVTATPYQYLKTGGGGGLGTTITLNVPTTHLLVGFQYRHWYGGTSDDENDELGMGFDIRILTAPIVGTSSTLQRSGTTTNTTASAQYTTMPSGAATTAVSGVPVGSSTSKVTFGLYEGPHSGGSGYNGAISQATFGLHYQTSIIQ